MNILENYFNKKKQTETEKEKYASSWRRSTAAMIDIWIVLFLRVVTMQFLGFFWLNQAIINFLNEFREHFGTETIKNVPEHINFIINHRIFIYALIFYAIVIMVGAVYHAYLNSSAWMGTIGKRLMGIVIVQESGNKITFSKGLWHYFLSVLPFAYILFLASYQLRHKMTFYQALVGSEVNLFFGIIFIIWIQIHLFTKRKVTAYDLICKTEFLNEKAESRWPWSKTI